MVHLASPRLAQPDLPVNRHVEASIEQRASLGHANTRAFLTHGGASSLEEGISSGLLLVVAPGSGVQGITEPGFRAMRLQRQARDANGARVAADAVEAVAWWGTGHLSSKLDTMNWFLRNDYDLLLAGCWRAARPALPIFISKKCDAGRDLTERSIAEGSCVCAWGVEGVCLCVGVRVGFREE